MNNLNKKKIIYIHTIYTQAYLGDIVGSVPEHPNKASIGIKQVLNILLVVLLLICQKKESNICEAQQSEVQ